MPAPGSRSVAKRNRGRGTMAKEVTFDLIGLGEKDVPKAVDAVRTAKVTVTRASSMTIPIRKAHVSVSGSDQAVDSAYEALVSAFPGTAVEVRAKEFPWHWEHKS